MQCCAYKLICVIFVYMCKFSLLLTLILILVLMLLITCCMEVEISAMMVVAALRMVEVVGAAGKPRQMSWYLVIMVVMIMIMMIPSHVLIVH